MNISEARKTIREDIRQGHHEHEAGYPIENSLNDHQRDLIAACALEWGEAWLGRINLYADTRQLPILWKWDGGLVYNFGASFVIPRHDAELERLIRERDEADYTGTAGDMPRIEAIFERINALGGHTLIWN